MKKLFTLIFLLPLAMSAQTTESTNTLYEVLAGGSTQGGTPPYYSPQDLTIFVGDTVKWRNVSGSHNVDGRTSSFPTNPVTFYSGLPSQSAWTYQFVFTTAGFYQYKCNQQGHATTQHGTITVVEQPTDIEMHTNHTKIMLHPNPSSAEVYFMIPYAPNGGKVVITDFSGRNVKEIETDGSPLYWFDVSTWAQGIYLVSLYKSNGDLITTNKFSKIN